MERRLSRKEFIVGMTSLAATTAIGIGEEKSPSNEYYEQILRDSTNIHALIHNAEILDGFDTLVNDANIHAMEIDIYSMNGQTVIGHSANEIVRIPQSSDELTETFQRISKNGFQIHIDLKSPDINVARDAFRRLPPNSLVSTPHHKLLDTLTKENEDNLLLYTINSLAKKHDFQRRLINGEELKNSGVSTHFNYLSKNDVSFYHDNGLYVLAYPADRLDVAARLCEYGVNGITSNEGKILKLLASNPQI